MCVAHATAVFGLAMVEQFEKPKAKQEPTRVSIQLVRAVPPPPQNRSYHHLLSRFFTSCTKSTRSTEPSFFDQQSTREIIEH